jgi:DNA-binding MarR family transcriptional regulator
VPNILIRSQSRLGISTTQFNIIVQLLSYWIDLARPPFPPKRDLAQRMSITQQTLRINLKALEEKRYISRVQQKTAAETMARTSAYQCVSHKLDPTSL